MAIPASDPAAPPGEAPTGLAITAGAKHRDVEITWDEPPDGSNTTGFALYRKWRGHQDAAKLCLLWDPNPIAARTSYRDRAIAAYDTTGNKNQYIYTLYPLNEDVPATMGSPNGCDDYEPTSVPSASVTATLAVSTTITPNADGDLEYLNPPAPTGLTLDPRFSPKNTVESQIRIGWQDVAEAPGYKVRYRRTGDTTWREHRRTRRLEFKREGGAAGDRFNNCTGEPRFENNQTAKRGAGVEEGGTEGELSGKALVWCLREEGKLLTKPAETWPPMYNAGPGAPNDNVPGNRSRIDLLERNERHEVQVATCTDTSCDATGPWSASEYATSS